MNRSYPRLVTPVVTAALICVTGLFLAGAVSAQTSPSDLGGLSLGELLSIDVQEYASSSPLVPAQEASRWQISYGYLRVHFAG